MAIETKHPSAAKDRQLHRATDVKAAVDLVVLAEALGVARHARACTYPFHPDSTPSLSVQPRFFNCFGCDAKGDAIAFVQRMRSCGFRAALAWLAEWAGLAPPSKDYGARATPRP